MAVHPSARRGARPGVSDALSPRLTALDRRVLDALPVCAPGWRARSVYGVLRTRYRIRDSLEDIEGILRGFEHLGQARQRGGWWCLSSDAAAERVAKLGHEDRDGGGGAHHALDDDAVDHVHVPVVGQAGGDLEAAGQTRIGV